MKHTRRRIKAVIVLVGLFFFVGLLLLVISNRASEFYQAGHQYCDKNPCKHGGTCISYGNSYTCICKTGYIGVNCHLDINKCASNPCQNGGTCLDRGNGYICRCEPRYSGIYCEKFTSWQYAYTQAGALHVPKRMRVCKDNLCKMIHVK